MIRAENGRFARFFAVVLAAAALAWVAGPGAPAADAASPCTRWGDVSPTKLTVDQAQRAVHCLVNRKRSQHGLPRLDHDRRLDRAAQGHSRHMQRTDCFSHQCPGEGSLFDRLRRVDYLHSGLSAYAYGENVAWGSGKLGKPTRIVDAWMKSSGHRSNILSQKFKDLGVGVADGTPFDGGADAGTYTTDFGMRSG